MDKNHIIRASEKLQKYRDKFLSANQIQEAGIPVVPDGGQKAQSVKIPPPCFTLYGGVGRWEKNELVRWLEQQYKVTPN